jgi:hypothetical protein
LQEALQWNEMVERRWGVVDVDDDDSSIVPIGRVVSQESEGEEEDSRENNVDYNIKTNVNVNLDGSLFQGQSQQQIQVSSSGEDIVNGIYQQCFLSNQRLRGNDHSLHIIYVHTSGPFHICNRLHDVCVFRKDGYGDKFRWCIGLVPCAIHNKVNDVDKMQRNADEESSKCQKTWEIDRAYIYYWMEVSYNTFTAASSCLVNSCHNDDDTILFMSKEWHACHGMRPTPSVKEITGQRGGWDGWWLSMWRLFW